jgi:ribosomal protein S12 methylthiotransferase accessory factor
VSPVPAPPPQRWDSQTAHLGRRLCSPRLGLVQRFQERRADDDGLQIVDYIAWLSRPHGAAGEVARVYGGGSHIRTRARAAALGEAVERYCLSLYDPGSLCAGTAAEIPSAAALDELTWFLDAQYSDPRFPLRRPSADRRFAWECGYSLRTGRAAWLPASLVYIPYAAPPGEPPLSDQVSSGTSCARSPAQAAYRAILELVERDALTICWESEAPYPPLDPAEVAAAAAGADRKGARIGFRSFDLTTDVQIPVVLTLALAERGKPAVAIGVAADLDAPSALRRSVEEAVTSWRSAAYLCCHDSASAAEIYQRMLRRTDFAHHSLFYAQPENRAHFDFLLDSPLPRAAPARPAAAPEADSAALLRECSRRLLAAGHEIVLFDLTRCDVAAVGLHVVRAVSTTLVRQTIGLFLRHLRNPRIAAVPYRLGYLDRPPATERILANARPAP